MQNSLWMMHRNVQNKRRRAHDEREPHLQGDRLATWPRAKADLSVGESSRKFTHRPTCSPAATTDSSNSPKRRTPTATVTSSPP
ncbi:MAG: hypothetical protein ACLRMJ_05720 [Alistipes finegoldii]